jgi:4-diphosphocytidyl-2-C-methyl-D-erythritol kinase
LLIAPGIHVSTATAYRDLRAKLNEDLADRKIQEFQQAVHGAPGMNDFESVVFAQHPRLRSLQKTLLRAGASKALMTGSGSAVFGFFDRPAPDGIQLCHDERLFRFTTVSRVQYRRIWRQALGEDPFDNAITSK